MLFKDVMKFLADRKMQATASSLLDAVEREIQALKATDRYPGYGGEHEARKDAQAFFAEDITRAMEDGEYLSPEGVLGHRERYMTAWAIAQIMVREQNKENGHSEERDASQTLLKLCEANASLGMKTVEIMMKLDEKDEEIKELRECRGTLSPPDPQLASNATELLALADMRETLDRASTDVMILAKHLCWMAERVHQGHHGGAGSWRECEQGVCGSMEYMLGQVALDKDLKPADRRV